MCSNGPTGKWGFNPAKQKPVQIVQEAADFFKYLCGVWDEATMDIINEEVALTRVNETNHMTEHNKSNVYISAFITGYLYLKLYKLLKVLQEKVLCFDTRFNCAYFSKW